MNVVFDTDAIDSRKRYDAWRDAICDCYVHVDVQATCPENYRGFIREREFGRVMLTDILLSEQRIRRESRHLSHLDKDCYYLQVIRRGQISVKQRGVTLHSDAVNSAIFCAAEPYELQTKGAVRAFYLELPRSDFASRFPRAQIPVSATFHATRGLGRIATAFCHTLAAEGSDLDADMRDHLGAQLMDLFALSLLTDDGDSAVSDSAVKSIRLRSIQAWIDQHLDDHGLTLEGLAAANGVSLRYLHLLFRQCEMTASEWIWDRRLQRCHDDLVSGDKRSITSIAFDHGFSSSSHFSSMFRRKYSVSPSDVRRASR